MTAKQRTSTRRQKPAGGPITVPSQLRWAEALDRRAKEVIEGVLTDEVTMAQIREGIAEMERGDPPVPWRQVRAQAEALRANGDV
jgi:hypothetical protein